ncbi:hypothetical protein HDU96_001857, partial [Phlyctochytrium bullatum]
MAPQAPRAALSPHPQVPHLVAGLHDAYPDMCGSCAVDPTLDKPFLLPKTDAEPVEVMKYRVDIAALGEGDAFESFNHASCQCDFPSVRVDMRECVRYTHLDHVHLRCCEDEDGKMWVMAIYGGIVAL